MSDRRLTPANERVAHVSLRGRLEARHFVEGVYARIAQPVADLLVAPNGARDRQVLYGARVLVLDRQGGFAFVRAEKDGFVGYLAEAALGPEQTTTHWVAVPATHLYSAPDIRAPEIAALSMGAEVAIAGGNEKFQTTADGRFIPTPHLRALGQHFDDPAAIAERFLGTPYLWGGNSHAGIDCSGLVQTAFLACGIPCPGDSDLQRAALGHALPGGAEVLRNDLLFWKGHCAIAVDAERIVHANGNDMAVAHERRVEAVARIEAQGEGPLLCIRRL